ncbi:diguanylate cyclase [Xanthobacter dioxanivorans]
MILSALTIAVCVLLILLIRTLHLALLHSQEVEEQLEVLAVTDQLTGLPNRRAFDLALASEMQRAARHRTPLAVLLIDVDHFKRINDRHGHGVGDVVLTRVARQLARSIRRPGDFAARYGGEEFVAICLPPMWPGPPSSLSRRSPPRRPSAPRRRCGRPRGGAPPP